MHYGICTDIDIKDYCQERTVYTRSCLVMCIWLWQRCRSCKLYLSYHVVLCPTAPPGVCCCVLLLIMYVAMHVRSCGLCVAISATTMVCSYFCTVATSALLQLCCVWGVYKQRHSCVVALFCSFLLWNLSERMCFK